MVLNAEHSNTKRVPKIPPNKPKAPDISAQQPYTPRTQSSQALSYTEGNQTTPTQTMGKRKHDDRNHASHRPPPSNPHSPSGSPELTLPPPNQPRIEPLVFQAVTHDPDHVMHDPFSHSFDGQPQELDWSDDDHYYTRLNRIQVLLRDLHSELDTARNELSISLTGILEDEDVEEQLIKLSAILPRTPATLPTPWLPP
jgi:hypothetical protein